MAAKKRAKGSKGKPKRKSPWVSRDRAEATRARARTRDPEPAADVKAFLDHWKDAPDPPKKKRDTKPPKKPAPSPEPSPAQATDSGRNVAALTKIWRTLERAEELVVIGGVGVSVTRTLMDEYGMTRRTARQHQAAAYLRLAEESTREGRDLRLVRYRRMLETIHERAFGIGEYKSAVAAVLGLVKMEGGFERHGMNLLGGRVNGGGAGGGRLRAVIDAQSDEDAPVEMSVEQLTAELVAARERGEDV